MRDLNRTRQLVKKSDELDKKMKKHPDIDKNIEALFAIGRRNRRLIKLLYLSLIVEAVLVCAVIYFASQAAVTRSRVENTHNSLVNSCESGNDFRRDNLALWQYILNIPPTQPPSPDQKKTVEDFSKFVKTTFALRNCSQIK